MAAPQITIIGTGNVGAALAKNFVRHGISVQLAAKDLEKPRALAQSLGDNARAVDVKSIKEGVVILAVPANAAEAAVADASGLAPGTIVVDCTNPLKWDNGPVATPPAEGSNAAHLQARFPKLRVIKAFNTFGAEFHERPEMGGTRADLYLAGDDADARKTVADLGNSVGFESVDVGPLRNARHLESLAILWIHLALVGGKGREVAFKLVHR